MKRAALINDLSGIGRCSLTVALPVISAMGIECAVLPTALLSNHTGFNDYTFRDLTDGMHEYIECWEKLDIKLDAVYSGFLGSGRQADITLEVMSRFCGGGIKLVDPVLGDDGAAYDTCSPSLCAHMRTLAQAADVITPNLTELCLLTDGEYPRSGISADGIYKMCMSLSKTAVTVVTGLTHDCVPEIAPDVIVNMICDRSGVRAVKNRRIPFSYCGTGDVFASVLCGALIGGKSPESAVSLAADFTERCVEDTYKNGGDRLYGVRFEDKLYLLKEMML